MKSFIYTLFLFVASTNSGLACEQGEPCRVDTGIYRYELPKATDGPVPLIVFLHGYGSSSERVMTIDRVLVDNAVNRGFAFLAAEGTVGEHEGAQNGWSVWPGFPGVRDDLAYLWEAVEDLSEQTAIDRSRIYLVGFSLGASATLQTACQAPDGFAAFAVLNGAMWNPLPDRCVSKVKLFHTHGFADDVMPLEGLQYDQVSTSDVHEGFELFRKVADNLQPDSFDFTGEYSCRNWDGKTQRFCLYGGNHDWPLSWMPEVTKWIDDIENNTVN